jgi:peptidyl-prolyl cis-trans isomerase SurA
MNYLKKFLLFILINSFLVFPLPTMGESLNRIIAIVNTHVITQQQLAEQIEITRQQDLAANKTLPSETVLRQEVLDHMIDNELQRQFAETAGWKIDEKILDGTIADIAQRNDLTIEQLRSRLEQDNLPYAKYRQQIREQLLISRVQQEAVGKKITVSEQEITDMLAHMPKSDVKTLYHIEDLLIPLPDRPTAKTLTTAQQTALSLLQQAKKGNTFQTLVEQAKNTASPLASGDLGWRPLNELPDIFQAYIPPLKPGEIAGPIQAQNGFHIIRLLEIKGNTPHYVTATHARHILIKTSPLLDDKQAEQRLKEIRAELLRGGDFAKLAKKYSQDPGSAFKGGDLGWTLPGLFDPAFEEQLNRLSLKQISLPFHTQFGWHIVQVLGRTKKLQTAQALSREQAAQLVYQKKFQQALQTWLQQLRRQAYVKIMPERKN